MMPGTITACVLFSALDLMKITTCHPAEPISRIMLVIFALYLNKKYKLIDEYSTHEIIFLEELKDNLQEESQFQRIKKRIK